MSPGQTRYKKTAVILHWVIALLIIFMLFLGEDLIRVPRGGDLSDWQPSAHASIGVLILLLTFARIGWRIANPPPPQPASMPRWQVVASAWTHGLFYVLMLALPLSGLLALQNYGVERLHPEAVSFFKLFSLYGLPDVGGWAGNVHDIAGNVTKALLAVHVLAALKHQFFD